MNHNCQRLCGTRHSHTRPLNAYHICLPIPVPVRPSPGDGVDRPAPRGALVEAAGAKRPTGGEPLPALPLTGAGGARGDSAPVGWAGDISSLDRPECLCAGLPFPGSGTLAGGRPNRGWCDHIFATPLFSYRFRVCLEDHPRTSALLDALQTGTIQKDPAQARKVARGTANKGVCAAGSQRLGPALAR